MKKLTLQRYIVLFLLTLSLLFFVLTLQFTRSKINSSFPGFLQFKNGVVGAFYLPEWSGSKKGIEYHHYPAPKAESNSTFSSKDYFLTVLLPSSSGMLLIALGALLYFLFQAQSGSLPLFLFHFFVGNYLILSPDFHLTYYFSPILLFCFAMIPGPMLHFALLFPEQAKWTVNKSFLLKIPYLFSLMLFIPYLLLFQSNPVAWISIEYVVTFYVMGAYLYWLGRLIYTLKKPQFPLNRLIAQSTLIGQLIGFTPPFLGATSVFIAQIAFPLNFATPLTLFFPISLLIGILLGRLRQSQFQLIQSEKMVTIGTLFAGLTHELNNPLTFIYSSIEPLKESLEKFRKNPSSKLDEEIDESIALIENGAERTQQILQYFRRLTYPEQTEKGNIDLRILLSQTIEFLSPKWKNRIKIVQHSITPCFFICRSGEIEEVFLILLSNACEAIPNKGTIECSVFRLQDSIQISIKDSGEGISDKSLQQIFDPFFTTKKPGKGTGLGLTLVREIIRRYNGEINVISEKEKGTEFKVWLPTQTEQL